MREEWTIVTVDTQGQVALVLDASSSASNSWPTIERHALALVGDLREVLKPFTTIAGIAAAGLFINLAGLLLTPATVWWLVVAFVARQKVVAGPAIRPLPRKPSR